MRMEEQKNGSTRRNFQPQNDDQNDDNEQDASSESSNEEDQGDREEPESSAESDEEANFDAGATDETPRTGNAVFTDKHLRSMKKIGSKEYSGNLSAVVKKMKGAIKENQRILVRKSNSIGF